MSLAAPDVAYLRAIGSQQDAGLGIVNPGEWDGKEPPRRDWMVERCFVRGSVGLVSGDGGIGKSLLMQQLCTCAALGRPFLGLTCQPGRALFFGAEDDRDELWRRQYDICRSMGVALADVGDAGLMLAPRVGRDNTLARLDRREWKMVHTDLFSQLSRRCLDEGIQYLVIDTATQTFAGNQNDEQQVVQYCNLLRRLAVLIQGVVLMTKHPSVAGRALGTGESGSVAWSNSVRARMYLTKDKQGSLGLEMMKSNYSKAGDRVPVVWKRGCFVLDQPDPASYNRPYAD